MSKYRYTMKLDMTKLVALITAATTRVPDGAGRSGLHTFTYNITDLTVAQRNAALATLPEWMRAMYSFDREVLPDSP